VPRQGGVDRGDFARRAGVEADTVKTGPMKRRQMRLAHHIVAEETEIIIEPDEGSCADAD
jgi:hypothetical protein